MKCYYHQDRDAVAQCYVGCGKSLCRECSDKYKNINHIICSDCYSEIQQKLNDALAEERRNKEQKVKNHEQYLVNLHASRIKLLKNYITRCVFGFILAFCLIAGHSDNGLFVECELVFQFWIVVCVFCIPFISLHHRWGYDEKDFKEKEVE